MILISTISATNAKKKCRQYSQEICFCAIVTNETISMSLLFKKSFSNVAMKPTKMKDHLERIKSLKKNKDLEHFNIPK